MYTFRYDILSPSHVHSCPYNLCSYSAAVELTDRIMRHDYAALGLG